MCTKKLAHYLERGYTLDMAVMGSLEPHQAVLHHRMVNEVVVAGALNIEMCTRTSGTDAVTARVHSGDAAGGSRLCIAPLQRLCDDSKISNYTVPHTQT